MQLLVVLLAATAAAARSSPSSRSRSGGSSSPPATGACTANFAGGARLPYPYCNPALPPDVRARDLVARLTDQVRGGKTRRRGRRRRRRRKMMAREKITR